MVNKNEGENNKKNLKLILKIEIFLRAEMATLKCPRTIRFTH